MNQNQFKWFMPGDLDGFFGLMIDNLIQILVLSFLLTTLCGVPGDFIYKVILPGTAISLLLGNLFIPGRRIVSVKKKTDPTSPPYPTESTQFLYSHLYSLLYFLYIRKPEITKPHGR